MPICTGCGGWAPAGSAREPCQRCGGAFAISERLQKVLSEADAEGLTFEQFQQRRAAERAEAEAARMAPLIEAARAREEAAKSQPQRWEHHPTDGPGGGQGLGLMLLLVGIPAGVVAGIVLLVLFLVLGLPPWIPIVATVVGVPGGWLLAALWDYGGWKTADWLAYQSRWMDEHGSDMLWSAFWLTAVAMPALVPIALALFLLAIL